jgi:hypothetical protein
MNESSRYDKRGWNGHRVQNRFSSACVLRLMTADTVPAMNSRTRPQHHFAENLYIVSE